MSKFSGIALLILVGFIQQVNAASIAVVNAASFVEGASLAPGTIVAVFGDNMASTTAVATDRDNLPRSLGGVTLTVAGVPSVLFFVSPGQINAQIDESVPAGMADVVVTSPRGTFTSKITIEAVGSPGLFSLASNGTREGAILNAATFELGPFGVKTNGSATFLAIFATGVKVSETPVVRIGGMAVPVQFAGKAPCCVGLEQINVQLTDNLEGAGRVPVVIETQGKTSNVVEITILPRPGTRSGNAEIGGVTTVANASLALVVDENADVVRVIDVKQQRVVRTIQLTAGSGPVAAAVNTAGTLAVVVERKRGRVAIIDMTTFTVIGEVVVGNGPTSVTIVGNQALVVNQGSNTISVVDLATRTVVNTIPVGSSPAGIAADTITGQVFVTNQNSGTVSVIGLGTLKATKTIDLGTNARPQGIEVIPAMNLAVVTEPTAGPQGQVTFINTATGIAVSVNANPDRSGGASGVAVFGNRVFLTNQTGGSVTVVSVTMAGGVPIVTSTNIKTDIGARALAVDAKDNLLLVTNEGSGTIVLIDLNTNQIVGRIEAVRS